MAKKSFSFFSKPKTNTQKRAQARNQYAARIVTSKGNYKSPKTGFQKVKDDVLMDLGIKTRDVDYYARLPDRQKRSREASSSLGKDIFGRPASERRSASVAETAAQRRARLKQEALAKRKAEGQEKRKKFYKEKGERLAKLRAKLLNLV